MSIIIEAACMSNIGRIRSNNEDNLYFDGKIMSISSGAAQKAISLPLNKWICFAVFDGMGGEEDGEVASHTAAETMKNFWMAEKTKELTRKPLLSFAWI